MSIPTCYYLATTKDMMIMMDQNDGTPRVAATHSGATRLLWQLPLGSPYSHKIGCQREVMNMAFPRCGLKATDASHKPLFSRNGDGTNCQSPLAYSRDDTSSQFPKMLGYFVVLRYRRPTAGKHYGAADGRRVARLQVQVKGPTRSCLLSSGLCPRPDTTQGASHMNH